jgi:hypothetical protein
METDSNNSHSGSLSLSTLWWIMGIFSTLILGGGGAWMTAVNSRLAKVDVLESRMDTTQGRLMRIEDKLDLVIDRLPSRNR